MNARATQRQRVAEIKTPLGDDVLLLSDFHAEEGLSTLFEVTAECLSHDKNLDFGKAIGQGCSIRLDTADNKKRYFHGVLTDASWFGEREGEFAYRLTLRPWLWLLSQTTDCRIFQNKTVLDIIKDVFAEYSFRDFEIKTNESYPRIDYCVWYRESALNFVSRLMEQYGIYYFFRHSDDKHMLVLADTRGSHEPVPELPQCRFVGMESRMRDEGEQSLTSWQIGRSFRSGKVVLNGFDFNEPHSSMIQSVTSPGGYTHDALEVYDYPEKFKKPQRDDLARKYAEARLHAMQSMDQRRQVQGYAPCLFPGGLLKVTDHPVSEENNEFLVVHASHSFHGEQFRSGGGSSAKYAGSYVFQKSDRPFKAPHVTPRPVISGPQTAMVVGPKGEEIHTDSFGRIKVKFHWDRRAPGDDRSSRWVRVAQIWSGKAWGGVVIPRIGMEVVIEFIEGDPDRPLVIGTVYNGANDVPFSLPANKTQSGMKSRSSKQATESRYNELVFEDKKDVEFVRFHAEKDLMSTVEDKETRTVKGKNKRPAGETTRETTIEAGDDVLTVATGDHISTIGRHQELTVAVNRTRNVGAMENVTVGATQTVTVGAMRMVTVGAAQTVTIGAALVTSVGAMEQRTVGHSQSITVGKDIKIEAGDSITLKVGSSSIVMTKSGITIQTGDLTMKSTGKTTMKASATVTIKGSAILEN